MLFVIASSSYCLCLALPYQVLAGFLQSWRSFVCRSLMGINWPCILKAFEISSVNHDSSKHTATLSPPSIVPTCLLPALFIFWASLVICLCMELGSWKTAFNVKQKRISFIFWKPCSTSPFGGFLIELIFLVRPSIKFCIGTSVEEYGCLTKLVLQTMRID